jgi:hypothetical protein
MNDQGYGPANQSSSGQAAPLTTLFYIVGGITLAIGLIALIMATHRLTSEEISAQASVDVALMMGPLTLQTDIAQLQTAENLNFSLEQKLIYMTELSADRRQLNLYRQIKQANPFQWWRSKRKRQAYVEVVQALDRAAKACQDGLLTAKTNGQAEADCLELTNFTDFIR